MLAITKKGKIQAEKAIKSAQTMLPPEMQDDFIAGINICKDVPIPKDVCESAVVLVKCAFDNISSFFLP